MIKIVNFPRSERGETIFYSRKTFDAMIALEKAKKELIAVIGEGPGSLEEAEEEVFKSLKEVEELKKSGANILEIEGKRSLSEAMESCFEKGLTMYRGHVSSPSEIRRRRDESFFDYYEEESE
jgi:hypothetical protein